MYFTTIKNEILQQGRRINGAAQDYTAKEQHLNRHGRFADTPSLMITLAGPLRDGLLEAGTAIDLWQDGHSDWVTETGYPAPAGSASDSEVPPIAA